MKQRTEGADLDAKRWPTEIRLAKDKRSSTPATSTRRSIFRSNIFGVLSPSAEIRGHNTSERKTVAGKKNVMIIGDLAAGNYAVKLVFEDRLQRVNALILLAALT